MSLLEHTWDQRWWYRWQWWGQGSKEVQQWIQRMLLALWHRMYKSQYLCHLTSVRGFGRLLNWKAFKNLSLFAKILSIYNKTLIVEKWKMNHKILMHKCESWIFSKIINFFKASLVLYSRVLRMMKSPPLLSSY